MRYIAHVDSVDYVYVEHFNYKILCLTSKASSGVLVGMISLVTYSSTGCAAQSESEMPDGRQRPSGGS